MPRATTFLLASPLAATLACAGGGTSAQRPAPASGSARCDGQRVLVVDNRTGTDVDVLVAPVSTGTPQLLATVRPGRQRVALAEPVLRAFAERNGQRVRGSRRPYPVTFSYACD